MGTGPQRAFGKPLPFERYAIVPGVELSMGEMTVLLGISPQFNVLEEPDTRQVLIIPDKQTMFWDLLSLWVEWTWPQYSDVFIESVREAASRFYRNQSSELSETFDLRVKYDAPRVIISRTLSTFGEKLPTRLTEHERLISAIAAQGDEFVETLSHMGLVEDPKTFKLFSPWGILFLTALSLSRGSYYRVTQNGQEVTVVLKAGIVNYRKQIGKLKPGEAFEEKRVEWNLPEEIVDVLARAVRTRESTLRAVADPEQSGLDAEDRR